MNAVVRSIPKEDAEHAAAVLTALKTSVYPGAADESIKLVLAYCKAAGLDPLQKPVHIVPMWDSKAGGMRDVVMPGVGLYRTQASRTGQFAGMTEAEFGPSVDAVIGGVSITHPAWARVTVKRLLPNGMIAEFTAREIWTENYAVKGGKDKSIAPNAMWAKRPFGQLAKCASAQALRIAFPELGAAPTAEEMEGRVIDAEHVDVTGTQGVKMPQAKPTASAQAEPSQPAATDAQEAPAGEGGIHVAANMRKVLLAKAEFAGLNEDDLVAKFGRIDQTNINEVLASLRELADKQ